MGSEGPSEYLGLGSTLHVCCSLIFQTLVWCRIQSAQVTSPTTLKLPIKISCTCSFMLLQPHPVAFVAAGPACGVGSGLVSLIFQKVVSKKRARSFLIYSQDAHS